MNVGDAVRTERVAVELRFAAPVPPRRKHDMEWLLTHARGWRYALTVPDLVPRVGEDTDTAGLWLVARHIDVLYDSREHRQALLNSERIRRAREARRGG